MAGQYRTNYNYNRGYLRICHTTPQQEAAEAEALFKLFIGIIVIAIAFKFIHGFWEERVPFNQLEITTQVSSKLEDEFGGASGGGYTINAQIHNGSALALTSVHYSALLLTCADAHTPNRECAVITAKDGDITTDLAPDVSGHFSADVSFDNENQYDGQHRVEVQWTNTVGERQGGYFSPERLRAAFNYHFAEPSGGW